MPRQLSDDRREATAQHLKVRAERIAAARLAKPRKRGIWSPKRYKVPASIKPTLAADREGHLELHREKMRNKAHRRIRWHRERSK